MSRRSSELDASGSGELDRPERFLSEVEAVRYAENLAGEKVGYDDTHRYSFVMFIDVKPKQDADGSSHLRYILFRGDFSQAVLRQTAEETWNTAETSLDGF